MAETGIETEDFAGTIGDAAAGAPWEEAPAGGVMAGVLASFSEHGFELGYRRAISDMIALLLLTAAEHRRDTPADPRLRAAVAEFVDCLDRQLQRLSPVTNGEVSDGLGI
jgi:Ser/Thr protein kinase RdoA (MazF antagonist)